MPVTVNTPFGQRTQSDPRDAVARRNFAIMQGLAQLQGGRDIAQIEANARMQAAEQDAARSQAWAELQQRMQADKLAQERAMFEQRLGAEDSRFDRRTARENELYERERAERESDPVRMLQRRLAERRGEVLTSMPTVSTEGTALNVLTGEPVQRPIPTPDFEYAATEGAGDPTPFGDASGGSRWLDAAMLTNPFTVAPRAMQMAGNALFGEEPNLEPLRRAYDLVRREAERAGFSPEDAHMQAITTLRRREDITGEMLEAANLGGGR